MCFVLFFSSLRIFYDSISLRHQRDRSTVDVPLLKLFFFSFPCAIPPVFFSFILWRARRISDDTPGSSPNCHHPIAACNDTHPQREVSFSFSDWGGALVQSGPTVGLYSFWFFKVLLPSWPGAINHGPRLLPPLSASLK